MPGGNDPLDLLEFCSMSPAALEPGACFKTMDAVGCSVDAENIEELWTPTHLANFPIRFCLK